MAQPTIQTSFASGEFAPALNARVDLAKYHSAAALLRNFFVDYRGGASTRAGTKYILQAYKSATKVRLIPFQASSTLSYVLEFGQNYIRFFSQGAAILEATTAITGVTKANPAVVTDVAHGYATGDWVYILAVGGMTQLNGNYYQITKLSANTYSLQDLNGINIDSTGYTTYTAGGTAGRVYTIASPYLASDLAKIKFVQDTTSLILCHPNYVPNILTISAANNWSLTAINFGATIASPTGVGVTSTSATGGSWNYAYLVTAVDINNQESGPSAPATVTNISYIGQTALTNKISWNAVSGALSYNVYKASPAFSVATQSGTEYGFIGNCTGVAFTDAYPGIGPDFAQTPPITLNPFFGSGVQRLNLTGNDDYTAVPTVTIAAPGAGGVQATGYVSLEARLITISNGGTGYVGGQVLNLGNGVIAQVNTIAGGGAIATIDILNGGSITSGGTPANPVIDPNPPGGGTAASFFLTWHIGALILSSPGDGYTTTPAVTISAGAATATATLGAAGAGNPSVPGFFQERLVLASPPMGLQTFFLSQPGSFFNFNISNPSQSDDAITGTIVSSQLNEIKSLITVPTGLIALTSHAAWLINGGGTGAITPTDVSANSQAFNGANDLPPLQINFDILYCQAKGSYIRDLTYNFYANIFTGTDISVLSSHLFYGYQVLEWAWAEEPFKTVWAIRNDGILLSLGYVKEQELIGWAHSDTAGLFQSVCAVTETVSFGLIDAVYLAVQRTINGNTVQYIERMAERIFPNGATDAWCVDAGIQYNGAPATTFTGAQHLAAATVTGLADGVVIPPFVMPITGTFVLGAPASKVTVGLAFTPQLQTLQIDLGEPTVQGKRKKITAVTVRAEDTLGLSIGKSFGSALVPMKDFVVGNVGTMSDTVVTNLVTGDGRTIIDPSWDVPGQYCIQQSNPLPATILGVIPEIVAGDTAK